MVTLLFKEKHSKNKVQAKAIFLPKKKIFFARYVLENINSLTESLFATPGNVIKKSSLFRQNNSLENERYEFLTA